MTEAGSFEAHGWFLTEPGQPLQWRSFEIPAPGPGVAVVEVGACGLCHTDLGFADGGVAPRHDVPLILGHEITGVVVAAGADADLVGAPVLVPSVMPCGECEFCKAGRSAACPAQKMPGNDVHGGFATHVVAPAGALVRLDEAPATVAHDSISVVADAVSTAYQATQRADLREGDVAFVVGAGGVGGFLSQIAKARGAHVIVCDVDDARLEAARAVGVDHACNVSKRETRDVRKEMQGFARELGVPTMRWRIFECSGTAAGQLQAYALLAPACTMVIVGFTRDRVEVRLSNLMAFDATVHGTWGCPLEAYPAILALIYSGQVQLEPYIERAPMSTLNETLAALREHKLSRRMVLDPRR